MVDEIERHGFATSIENSHVPSPRHEIHTINCPSRFDSVLYSLVPHMHRPYSYVEGPDRHTILLATRNNSEWKMEKG